MDAQYRDGCPVRDAHCAAYTWRAGPEFRHVDVHASGPDYGDPDFDLLRITAGNGFGLPSPGHTTLTQQPGGNWAVDSFFDITYRIDSSANPGSPLGGMSGSTTATIRMSVGDPVCGPDPTGNHCLPTACPDPNDRCSAHCVNYNPATQNTTVLDCQCRQPTSARSTSSPRRPAPVCGMTRAWSQITARDH